MERPQDRRDGHPSIIELSGVSKTYGSGGRAVRALEDVTLRLSDDAFTVVLGPSGSGKTTLLNIIGALDSPTAGAVRLAGRDITRASRGELFEVRRRTVSFIFQSFNLFPGLTARENVQFGIDAAGRREGPEAAQVLASVGLEGRLDQFPHQLSGGEQQRVAIARALATGNPVLLADEPTGELDFQTGVRILELLRAQVGPGRAVVVVTHNREIARAADRVIELSSGRVVADGPPEGGRVAVADLYW
ncbi:MAG TPA: ABC transporter ATP-binding protein [Dehalococcoidia bacterium]|nr:ABC transporter ATP-binding protein [Dehalococcoidia bacterium]